MTNSAKSKPVLGVVFAAISALILAFTGCNTTSENSGQVAAVACDTAQAAYVGYLAALNAGLEVDEKTKLAAAAAAATLQTLCGWHAPTNNQTRTLVTIGTVNAHGVPVLFPPR